MKECISDGDCAHGFHQRNGYDYSVLVNQFYPGIIGQVDSPNMIIEKEYNNYFLSQDMINVINSFPPDCKFYAELYNQIPLFYYSNKDNYIQNMSCMKLNWNNFTQSQHCFSNKLFHSSIVKEKLLREIEVFKCDLLNNNCKTRNEIKEFNVLRIRVCYKHHDKVFKAFIQLLEHIYSKSNYGEQSQDILKEFPKFGPNLENICFPNCLKCSSIKSCEKCEEGFQLSNSKCIKCPEECQNCQFSKDLGYQCLECNNDKITHQGQCLEDCPQSFFRLQNKCIPCQEGCINCINNQNNCSKCKDGYILQGMECLKQCSVGYYFNQSNFSCIQCRQGCFSCIDKDTCLQCNSQYNMYNGICLQNCQKGYLQIQGRCVKCSKMCSQCSNSIDQCTECPEGYFLQNMKCVKECQANYYIDLLKKECLICDNSCNNCTGPTNQDCLECNQNYCLEEKYVQDGQSFQRKCLPSPINNQCLLCADNGKICLKCMENLSIVQDDFGIQYCQLECPHDFIAEDQMCKQNSDLYYMEYFFQLIVIILIIAILFVAYSLAEYCYKKKQARIRGL